VHVRLLLRQKNEKLALFGFVFLLPQIGKFHILPCIIRTYDTIYC
jgi:hypothetical protein